MSNKLYVKSGYVLTLIAQSVSLAISMLLSQPLKLEAQSVIPAPDGTGTQVRIHENQIQIYGGSLSSDEANLFHSLQQFGLTEGQIANFLANPNLNNIVTRITGGDPSVINGVLQVTGGDPNLFLMNPSGIIFGATAQLNLPASFAATTANGIQFGNQWFSATGANNYGNLVGNPTAFYFDSNVGTIINAGNLAVNPQHSLLFLGGSVINTGQLSVPEGQVLVTAVPDRNVLHLQVPGNILTLEVKLPDELAAQPHAWTLPIAALPELLTSEAVTPESLGLAITAAGDVQLAGSNMRIPDQAGTAIASGSIDVSGDQGGSVGVFGDLVGVADAQIDASGTFGGGTVLVGGEYRGQGTVPTAERTYIDSDSSIAADALTSGDGGRVIVWADDATAFYGGITARGGANWGDGGFAEISGREHLAFDGNVNLSASMGESGILLLDPDNIFIINGDNADDDLEIEDGQILVNDSPGQNFEISEQALERASRNQGLVLQASENIVVRNLNDNELTFSSPANFNVNLKPSNFNTIFYAGNSFIMEDLNDRIISGGTNLVIEAENGDVQVGGISTVTGNGNAGSVTITAGGQVLVERQIQAFTRSPTDNGGSVTITAGSDIRFLACGAGGVGGATAVCIETFADNNSTGAPGNIELYSSEGSIDVSRGNLNARGFESDGGNITLRARGDILTADLITRTEDSGVVNRAGNIRVISSEGRIDTTSSPANNSGTISATSRDSIGNGDSGGEVYLESPVSVTVGSVIAEGQLTGSGVLGNGGSVTVNTPDLRINGEINVSGNNQSGFANFNSEQITLTSGANINAGDGVVNITDNATITTNSFNITAGSIQGQNSNTLTIQPETQGITLGDVASETGLNLSAAQLSLFERFSNVNFNAGSNSITISSPITLNTPTQLITNNNDVNVNANITTLGQDLAFDSDVVLGSNVQISTGSEAGNLAFLGSIRSIDEAEDGADYGLTLEAGEQIQFLDAVGIRELSILSAQALLVETGITVENTDLTFNIPVILTGDTVTFSTEITQITQTDGAGDITFNNTLNSEANETNNLELTPGAENITFNGVVGTNNSQRLGDITLGRFNTLTNNSTIRASSLQQTSGTLGQSATLSGNINTTGSGVNLTTTRDITASDLTRTGGSTTLVSRSGSINVTNVTATGGNFSATANSGVAATTLSNTNGAVNLRSNAANVQATDISATGDIAAIANTGVTATNIDSTGGAVTFRSNTRNVQATDVSAAGDISAIANTGVVATNIDSANGNVTLRSGTANVQATDISATGDVAAISNTRVVASNIDSSGTVTFRSGTSNVQTTGVSATGDVAAIANTGVTASNINSTNGDVTLRSSTRNVQATDVTAAGDVTAIANTGVTATNIDSTGGAVTLRSGTANVQATSVSATGDVTAIAARNITASDINSIGGSITATANNGAVQVSNLTSSGDVSVTALGTIRSTNGITSNGGNISLSSPQSITTETLTSNGGDISLGNNGSATGSVQVTGDINALGTVYGGDVEIISEAAIDLPNTNINTSGRTGSGGDITLRSVDGRIAVNNLTATGRTGGGNVSVIASELENLAITLSIGEIDTSASIGDGGNVLLDPFGNIQVSFINAQGGINGTGGDVTTITTGGLFRATDSFIDQNGINASISAAGGAGEGSISIFHNGGDLFIPFFVAFDGVDVSAANASGTVGALTTGNPTVNEDNIIENRVFPGTFVQDRIGIFTSDRLTLALDDAVPDAEPDDLQLENADQQPFWLDEYFTRRTEEYLGRGFDTDVKSLEEIQEDLRRIEEETGVKPALIYVVFEPEEVLQTIAEGGPGSPDDLVNQGWLQRFREMGSDRLQLVLVTSEGQPIFRRPNDDLEATRDEVPDLVELFRDNLLFDFRNPNEAGEYQPDTYLFEAQALYNLLVKPLEEKGDLQEIDNLVFIMDAGLRSTPLAVLSAMHSGNEFIIKNYSVGLMPSFSLTDTRYQDIRNTQVLAMGMDDFSQYTDFSNLPGVRDEIRLINQEVWPESAISDQLEVLNTAFTKDEILERRRENSLGIIHLATHASFNSGTPQDSFIQLWNEQLKFDDLRDLEFNNPPLELLVLSACTTALDPDDESAELGFAGISVLAGAKSSLASLWKVDDLGTLGLMLEFYTQLQTAPIKAEALRQAQLSMLNGSVFTENNTIYWTNSSARLSFPTLNTVLSHPAYWAAFTVVGSPW